MALSTCAKCDNHFFELKEHEPRDARFKVNFVQCASCGSVVGLLDYYNLGDLLKQQERLLKRIAARIGA